MKLSNAIQAGTKAAGKTMLTLKKYSPQIAIVVGIGAGIGAAVWACQKTATKLPKVKEEVDADISLTKELYEDAIAEGKTHPAYNEYRKELIKSYGFAAVEYTKLYAGPVITGGLAVGCILTSHNIMAHRNAALTATVATFESMYNRYRKNVIDTYGKEVDQAMRFGTHKETVVEEVVDEETGKKKKVKTDITVMDDDGYEALVNLSDYARIFEEGASTQYVDDANYNNMFLTQTQRSANRKLKTRGYLFLNEVYEMLGFMPTEAGQDVGWIYSPDNEDGDNYVDFNIRDIRRKAVRDFMNGYEMCIVLDFNVDGNIRDKFLKSSYYVQR